MTTDPKEKRLHGARGEPRGNKPRDETQRKQERSLLEHKEQPVGSLHAERRANAHFAGVTADRVGHETVEADQRAGECDGSEDGKQRGLELAWRAPIQVPA